jgi:hypothetical protein
VKTINEILSTDRPLKEGANPHPGYGLTNGRLERGMTGADWDGVGPEDTFIPKD